MLNFYLGIKTSFYFGPNLIKVISAKRLFILLVLREHEYTFINYIRVLDLTFQRVVYFSISLDKFK